jgi:hypothetical protein
MDGGVQHAANWYPDPQDLNQLRCWDGQRWTEHTAARAPEQPQQQPPPRSRGGLLGNKNALEAELAQLRAVVDGFGYAEREALQAQISPPAGRKAASRRRPG